MGEATSAFPGTSRGQLREEGMLFRWVSGTAAGASVVLSHGYPPPAPCVLRSTQKRMHWEGVHVAKDTPAMVSAQAQKASRLTPTLPALKVTKVGGRG